LNYTRYETPRAVAWIAANWRNLDVSGKVGSLQDG